MQSNCSGLRPSWHPNPQYQGKGREKAGDRQPDGGKYWMN